MKTIQLILICRLLSSCKSLSRNTIAAASNTMGASSSKESSNQSEKAKDGKLLKQDANINWIHDSIREKIKNKRNN